MSGTFVWPNSFCVLHVVWSFIMLIRLEHWLLTQYFAGMSAEFWTLPLVSRKGTTAWSRFVPHLFLFCLFFAMLQFVSEVIFVATVKWILLFLIKVGWRRGPKISISKSGIFGKKKFCWSPGKLVQTEEVNVDDSIVAITLNCKFLSKLFSDSKSHSFSLSLYLFLTLSLSLSLSLSPDLSYSLSVSISFLLSLSFFLSLSVSLSVARSPFRPVFCLLVFPSLSFYFSGCLSCLYLSYHKSFSLSLNSLFVNLSRSISFRLSFAFLLFLSSSFSHKFLKERGSVCICVLWLVSGFGADKVTVPEG